MKCTTFKRVLLFVLLILLVFIVRSKMSKERFTNGKNLVLITSVIYPDTSPLAYSNVRSVFTTEDRIQQTKNTIKSIREKIPDSYIVLIEGSSGDVDPSYMFKELVDEVYYVKDETKQYINGKFKGLGETSQLLDYFNNNVIPTEYKSITKISGRYFLNDQYNFEDMPLDKFCVARERRDWIYTSSYRVPGKLLMEYIIELNRVFNIYIEYAKNNDNEMSLESVMFNEIEESKMYFIDLPKKYGVSGYISVNGDLIESYT